MKRIYYVFGLIIFMLGCSNPSDGNPENGSGNGGSADEPNGVLLVFPDEDSLCNEGTNLTLTESTVFFEWEPNDNAMVYTLSVENLTTGAVDQYQTEDFIFPVTIERAQPFRWFVNYDFQDETKESAIWNFYNAGPGIETYPPFPTEIISPTMAQSIASTNSVTLEWSGEDVDNDIVDYDVYFGENNPPSLSRNAITATQLTVSVVPGTIYFWNVITKDAAGNTSESGVYQFRVLE
jgi:hypothetical protein